MMWDGREYVLPIVSTGGEQTGMWLVQHPGYQPVIFDNPEDACALADAIDRVHPDGEEE